MMALNLRESVINPPASNSQVVELQVCATTQFCSMPGGRGMGELRPLGMVGEHSSNQAYVPSLRIHL